MSENVVTLSNDSFEQDVLNADLPVLVFFEAAWNGPCRMILPTLATIAEEYEGRAIIATLNVDMNQGTASAHGVQSVPTFILFKNGGGVDRMMGAMPPELIAQFIDNNL